MANLSFLARAAMCLAALLFVTDPGAAASKKTLEQRAWAKCRAEHGSAVYKVVVHSGDKATCYYREKKPDASDYEKAIRFCKAKYGPSVGATAFVRNGEWYCKRYI
ncbi:MAG: hypothetical protein AB7E66_01940 [Parvibaculaceae bacterium]